LNPKFCAGKAPKYVLPKENNNIWVSGGAIRQWVFGDEPASDIDLFFKSKEIFDKEVERLDGQNFKRLNTANHLVSFDYHGQLLQCINYSYFESTEKLLDSFDFNVCQFAWTGGDIITTAEALLTTGRKQLMVHKIDPNLAADSLRRAFKYQSKGYKPCLGTIRDLANSFVGVTAEQIQEQITISPGGGTRIVGVD
jgi:hypothetical protein